MNSSLKWKSGLLAAIVLFSLVTLLPSFYKDMPDWWKKYLAPKGLQLGLDLQGGMHLVLRADIDRAVRNSLDLAASDLKDGLSDQGVTAVLMDSPNPEQAMLTLPNTGAVDLVKKTAKDDFPNLDVEIQAEAGSFPRITLRLKAKEVDFIRQNAVAQSLEIIRNRIDQFGVAEPVIIRQGENEIVVQLPGVKDPERAIGLIGQTAQLEFKMVADEGGLDLGQLVSQAIAAGQWQEGGSVRQLNLALQASLPKNTEIAFERNVDKKTKKELKTPLLLESRVMMTGEMVKTARMGFGGTFNEPLVNMELTGRGSKIFADVTSKNVNRRFAIVLDDVVRSAPVIREKILGGSAQISGSFTTEEAADLAIVLRAGALPAPVEIIQNMTVGASLGQDAIDQSVNAGLFGAVLVLVFIAVYYRLAGVIADISLALNILFLVAGLAIFGATLTLPGVAGIILSIGMGVDANVLIYERMREEFHLGKSVRSGIEAGFDNAFWSIVDSQLTTLITALALFLFGTGPIKGFAVTLSLGIVFNLVAALFCSRLAFDWIAAGRKVKELKFMLFLKQPSYDFMGVRKIAFACSVGLVLLGVVSFVQILLGNANIGVDFTGGSLLQYKAEKPFDLQQVRAVLSEAGSEVDLQQVTGENRLIVKMKKTEETVGHLGDTVAAALAKVQGNKFELESQSEIGSSVSETLRNQALIATAISLVGIILYLGIRFDFSFGVAAAAASFHDVLAVLGICWLLDVEVTLLLLTALLTLAGYSLNDTVVIFDRIRENLHKFGDGKTMHEIINISTNEVVARTLIIATATFMSLTALYFFGGAVIHDFALALLLGMIVGTYSSVFVASPLLPLLKTRQEAKAAA
ncbi:MAG: protein translocase subunit SecD [Candidatus Electronema sp. V4]|uniref:protein translocase subunit SecD n=1 Tax=Candidatus Electronema sp. V4 TaxID=3454756 RepID=UPI00405576C6